MELLWELDLKGQLELFTNFGNLIYFAWHVCQKRKLSIYKKEIYMLVNCELQFYKRSSLRIQVSFISFLQ